MGKVLQGIYAHRNTGINCVFDGEQTKQSRGFRSKYTETDAFFFFFFAA